MRLKALAAASLLLPLVALPAAASSLPHADFGTTPILGLGLGGNQTYQPGGSFSLDVPLGESVMVGGAVASTLYGGLNFDVRGVYRFVLGEQGSGPSIAAMLGVWGQPGLAGFQTGLGAAPFLGFGLSYPINDRFTVRLDLAYAPFFDYSNSPQTLVFLGGPPSSGVEVGYHLTRNLEATLGLNGRGDFLGAAYVF